MSDFPITSSTGKQMIAELPEIFEFVKEYRVIVQAHGQQFDQLQADIDDQLVQGFISSATWGLDAWEAELSITPPAGQPIAQRRAVVRSKIRGYGKFTGRLMQAVAMSYDNGQIDVSFNPSTSTFTVRFLGTLGLPPNIADLQAAIADILPAHQLVTYTYRYLTISEVNSMTIQDIETHSLSDFAPFLG